MTTVQAWLRKYDTAVLIFSLFFFLFCALYRLRFLDDSRLASWDEVFSVVSFISTACILCISLIAALMLSHTALMQRNPVPVLFILSFFISVLFWQEPEMIVDASRYFTQAKHLELYGFSYFIREWGNGINAWTDLPAVPFMYGALFMVFGEGRLIIQVFNAFLFSSAVVLTYLTGRELWDSDTGLYAALLLLGIPYMYVQVPLMLVDLPAMSLLMLSIYTFLLALRRGGKMVAIASFVIFVTFFTKYSAWLMLTVIPVIYAVELYQNRKAELDRYALRGIIVFFASFTLISLVIAVKHDEIVKQIHLLITYQMPGLKRWGESLVSTYLFQIHPLIPILAAVSLMVAFRRRDAAYIVVLWIVLVILALQVRRIRYIIMMFPLLSLMASYGLDLIRDKVTVRYLVYSTAAFSMTIALTGFLPFLKSTSSANLRDAGQYLDSLDVSIVEVFTPVPQDYVMSPAVSVPLLDLYTKKRIFYDYEHADYPLPEDMNISALRFTWTYANPLYYQGQLKEHEKTALLVITDSLEGELPPLIQKKIEGFANKRIFAVNDNAFRHKTLVTVFH